MQKGGEVSGRTVVTHPALLADSGYVGLDEAYYELITCKKKPPMRTFSQKDTGTNSELHSDRVLVENFFGRLEVTFGILAGPYRCSLNSLEDIVVTYICLLNLKLRRQPLRAPNNERYIEISPSFRGKWSCWKDLRDNVSKGAADAQMFLSKT